MVPALGKQKFSIWGRWSPIPQRETTATQNNNTLLISSENLVQSGRNIFYTNQDKSLRLNLAHHNSAPKAHVICMKLLCTCGLSPMQINATEVTDLTNTVKCSTKTWLALLFFPRAVFAGTIIFMYTSRKLLIALSSKSSHREVLDKTPGD